MATQVGATTANKRPRNQIAELNARQALLPTMLYNKQRADDIARQEDQFSRQHALAQQTFASDKSNAEKARETTERASRMGMGLSAAKLGTNISLNHGDKTVGSVIQGTKNMWNGTPGLPTPASSGGVGGFFNSLNIGSMFGGGLAGFGATQLLGKNSSKIKKGLVGAGIGAGMGLLSGGIGGATSGGFGGLLGSLFG